MTVRGQDPALPAARHLFGEEAGEILAAALTPAGLELRRWTLRDVHHRVGRSVSAVYVATVAGEDAERDILLVAHVDTRPVPPGAVEVAAGDDRVLVWRFPKDPFLPGLPSAVHRGRVRELLDALDGPAGEVTLHTRAYRPSRRAVVEVTVDGAATDADGDPTPGRLLYLKLLSGDRAARLADVHRHLRDVLPVPRVIGTALSQGLVALEALRGRTLRTCLVAGHDLPSPQALFALSDRLATSGLEARGQPRRFADATRHVRLLSHLLPDQAGLLERILARTSDLQGPMVPVHGDFHEAQILVEDGEVVGLLDIDGAGPGLLAEDAGSMVAHLEAVGEVWPEVVARARDYAGQVAEVYRQRVPADDLAKGAAQAWLGLATGPYRAQDVGWPELTRQRIARAAAWVNLASG